MTPPDPHFQPVSRETRGCHGRRAPPHCTHEWFLRDPRVPAMAIGRRGQSRGEPARCHYRQWMTASKRPAWASKGEMEDPRGLNSGFEVGLVLGVTPAAPSGARVKRRSSRASLVKNLARQKQRWPDRGFPRPGLNVGDNLLSR